MRPHFSITTAASLPPASLNDALSYMRVTDNDEAPLIEAMVQAANSLVEDITGRAAMRQTVTYTTPTWASITESDTRTIHLPKPPLASVTAVRYYDDTTETLTTYASSNYIVVTTAEPGFLQLDEDSDWPDLQDRADAIQIEYLAGPANPASVDRKLWLCVLLIAAAAYDNRGMMPDGGANKEWLQGMPQLEALLNTLRAGGYVA